MVVSCGSMASKIVVGNGGWGYLGGEDNIFFLIFYCQIFLFSYLFEFFFTFIFSFH